MVAGEQVVVAVLGRLAAARPGVTFADRVGLAGGLHLGEPEPLRRARRPTCCPTVVVDEADRVVAVARVDVLLPEAAVLDEVLIGVDDGHGSPRSRTVCRRRATAPP